MYQNINNIIMYTPRRIMLFPVSYALIPLNVVCSNEIFIYIFFPSTELHYFINF